MPELPDVEIFKRVLDQTGLGNTVGMVLVPDPGSLDGATATELQRHLKGVRLSEARRHGKVLFGVFGKTATLAMHFGTNGSLQALPADAETPPSTRLLFEFSNGHRLAYVNPRRIGHVGVVASADVYVASQRLGPDALDPAFDEAAFEAAFAKRGQAIKAVLMDQQRMAGIGNTYADEILFQARLHPAVPARALEGQALHRLFEAMKRVLRTAIDCGAGAEDFTDRLPEDFLIPERHTGGHCPRDGTPLVVEKRGGRTSYHCPRCQSDPEDA